MAYNLTVRSDEDIKHNLDEIAKSQDRTPHALMVRSYKHVAKKSTNWKNL